MSSRASVGGLLPAADVPDTLPLVPLRNSVLFPVGVLPMAIGANGTRAVEAAIDGLIVVATCRDPNVDDPSAADVFAIGVLARVVGFNRTVSGCRIAAQALARCRLTALQGSSPHLRARVTPISAESDGVEPLEEVENFRSVALQIVRRSPGMPAGVQELVRDIRAPAHLVDLVVANFELSVADKQQHQKPNP